MKITVFGTGYVGLVQAAVLASAGHQVMCVDIDQARIENLKAGIIPIFEPMLDTLIHTAVAQNQLCFTTKPHEGVRYSDIQCIAVGTPANEDGSVNLSYVKAVVESIAEYMTSYRVIVNKSTVPVGTADSVREMIQAVLTKRAVNFEFDVVSNPEFLKEGAAVQDCRHPDRIIIGTNSQRAEALLRELYAPFGLIPDQIIIMDARSAELTKYAANSMLATKISFMNELANLAEKLGADIEAIRHGIGSDSRIGYSFIAPGLGYGGSCFPKDMQALIHAADSVGFDASVLKAVEIRNTEQKKLLFRKIQQHFQGQLKNKTIAIWGLAFKPNTSDVREASSRVLLEALWDAGAIVQAYDPAANQEIARLYPGRTDLILCTSKEAALQDADALAIVTEWTTFQTPNFYDIRNKLKQPVIFDGRNLYDPKGMLQYGFTYYAIGRGANV